MYNAIDLPSREYIYVNSLNEIGAKMRLHLVWVPGVGNKAADDLAEIGSSVNANMQCKCREYIDTGSEMHAFSTRDRRQNETSLVIGSGIIGNIIANELNRCEYAMRKSSKISE